MCQIAAHFNMLRDDSQDSLTALIPAFVGSAFLCKGATLLHLTHIGAATVAYRMAR